MAAAALLFDLPIDTAASLLPAADIAIELVAGVATAAAVDDDDVRRTLMT